jgi:hypothetical protein
VAAMSLTALVKAIRQQETELRVKEGELLNQIAIIDSIETAEAAKEYFDHAKHAYSFAGYLYKLQKLINLLAAGMQTETAFKFAESCIDTDALLQIFRQEARNE